MWRREYQVQLDRERSVLPGYLDWRDPSIQRPFRGRRPTDLHHPEAQRTEAEPNSIYFWQFGREELLPPFVENKCIINSEFIKTLEWLNLGIEIEYGTWRTVASEAPCSSAAFRVASGWLVPKGLRIIRFRRRESSSQASRRQKSGVSWEAGDESSVVSTVTDGGGAQAPCFDTIMLVIRSTRRRADEASRRRAALIMWSQTPSSSRRSSNVWAHWV